MGALLASLCWSPAIWRRSSFAEACEESASHWSSLLLGSVAGRADQALPVIRDDHREPLARSGAMRVRSLAACSAELHHQSGRDQCGKLSPLTRQLFVLPFAFTAPAVGKVLALCRPRPEFFSHIKEPTPEQAVALHPCGWIRGGKGRIHDCHGGIPQFPSVG